MSLLHQIAKQLSIDVTQVQSTLTLLEDGNTVPFIARYRKEMTRGLDEEAIRHIEEEYKYQVSLQKRKEDVLRLIAEQGKLSEEIQKEVEECTKLSQVEDIYRPYQQKRKTRATTAIALGLEPLAGYLLAPNHEPMQSVVNRFITEQVTDIEEALQGAMDIIAEQVADNPKMRNRVRFLLMKQGSVVTKAKKNHGDEAKVYKMYYEYTERLSTLASHRVMAVDRAEKEKVITVALEFEKEALEKFGKDIYLRKTSQESQPYVEKAMEDGLKRLLIPSVERELRSELTAKAHEKSIEIFSMNIERLLLQPPMKDKMILGVDPAFRTGCKLAVIDATGKMLAIDVMYPHQPVNKTQEAKRIMQRLLESYDIGIIAIGNGTASRETQSFVAALLSETKSTIPFTLVSEAGASVYSASPLAKQEFPDLQVEQRSAVSIARRIMDPLAELIKIDPQSIGVGQYQHDLPTSRLSERLSFVIMKAVNLVGVNVNTASTQLLQNVSGLSAASAKEIVAHRESSGPFKNRSELKKVKKIGAKSYEQAAGFLRVLDGEEQLDSSAIHPESYPIVRKLLIQMHVQSKDIGTDKIKEVLGKCDLAQLCVSLGCDEYTMQDIVDALKQPKRDYRDQYAAPLLRQDVLTLDDLHVGDELEGVVRNVVDFGVFVDIGLKNDGLIHVSKLGRGRVSHPSEIVSIGDILKVKVYNIDHERHKVQLSLV